MKKLYFPAITGFLFQQCNFFSNIFNRRSIHFKKFIILFLGFVLVSLNNKSYADVTLTTTTLAAGNINQGSNNSIVYIVQMGVTVGAVNVNNIQFTLNGTLDANDLSVVSIYYNPTAATISGSSLVNNAVATFASGHTYSIPISTSNPIGSAGYFIIAVNVSSSATDNNTIQIDGSTNPVVFGFTTSPNIINSQSNAAGTQTIQASDITLTTSTLAAANINQGTNNNIVYVAQMNVGTEPVNVNNIQFTLNGTLDANDLSVVSIYYNPTAATISGSSLVNNAVATFASGHTYSIPISTSNPVGSAGYFIIAVNVSSSATDNNTIQIDGSTNPVVFGFTTSPNIINSQRNVAGIQTIQASDITLTTSTLAAGNINQGTNNNIVYIAQMNVGTEPVNVNNIQFTLNGTLDANDLSVVSIYYNPTAATISGSSLVNNAVATFASGHTYSIPISTSNPVGSAGYFIIAVNVSSSATDNNTIQIDGSTNPVVFGFTTSPNIINSQSNVAGTQTIQASDITLTTSTLAAGNINQGTNNNIVYIAQMNVGTEPVNVNNIQFTLNGTLDANDLSVVSIYYNPTAATISGSSLVNNAVATFASGHTYSIPISTSNPIGSAGYFIIAVNVSSSATDNNTIQIDGATNPVVFGFTTSPNIINSQSNAAGKQTIQASDITLTTSAVAANNFSAGTNNDIVYVTQMSVATEPVNVNNIQFTLNGTFDANDLTVVSIYYNSTAATISGSSLVNNAVATFASGHTYSIPISTINPIGSAGYFIIAVNVSPSATTGNTVKINGLTDPVLFGFTTTPNVTNNQTDLAGLHTLPLQFVGIKAYEKNSFVAVEWKVAAELNIDRYFVERSANGTIFNAIGQKIADGSSTAITYSLADVSPLPGNNFYRINALNKDGKPIYSSIVRIYYGKGKEGFSVYPNPVIKNQQLTFELQNLKKDNYIVSLFNQQGQLVIKQSVEHAGGNSVQTMNLPKMAAGIYSIEVESSNIKFVKPLIIQ